MGNRWRDILSLKILFGYFIILMVIANIVFVILREKQQLHKIDADVEDNRTIRHEINTTHRLVTELATLGESVIIWEKADYLAYHEKRVCTDSSLQKLRYHCSEFIRPGQFDTLRGLLASKEQHLFHIMQTFHKQEEADSLLVHRLPVVARQVTHPREITRKKKGIAGWLGKKETIRIAAPTKTLYTLNERLIEMQEERRHDLENYTDTLRAKNRKLNSELMKLISQMDSLTQTVFQQKERRIEKMRQRSFRFMSCVLAVAIVLLLISYLIIRRDLRHKETSRRVLEESIRQNKALLDMRKNIILTISHDIRGPLGSINGSAELAMDTRDKKKRNNHLANIQLSCRHILHLVNNLLDIYRMNECKETRNDIPFRLDRLIEQAATGYLRKSNDKGILFTTQLSGIEIGVIGDADRIEQILDNLLANALKFTEAGEIRLSATYENERLTMEVRDTGIGMDEKTQSCLFEPFERGAQKFNPDGFGLGLSITKGLVGLLGGTISVESSIGKGSTFCVILPLLPTGEYEEKNSKPTIGSMRLPRQVLAIDDDAVQLEVIREMLERNGVSCTACNHVREVVEAFRRQDFDMILTDIQMSGTNGFDLLKLLRNSHIGNSRTVPVMAMTARGDRGAFDFVEAGFAGCISKPFSTQELLLSLSSVVQPEREENGTADFKGLVSETSHKQKILELFIKDAERSITELQEAMVATDRKKLCETVHRMFPVWELLQADKPLRTYRHLLHDKKTDEQTIREETEKMIAYTHGLIVQAGNELVKWENGTEDIDS